MNKHNLECDCLVIGSGPGGAMTALVLAEAKRDVIVLEEGMEKLQETPAFSLDELNDLYRYGGVCVSRGSPKVSYLEGCCLGGASEINAGLYHRPLPQMLDKWEKEYDVRDFGANALETFFEMNEKALGVRSSPFSLGVGAGIIERGAGILNWKSVALPRMWDYSCNIPQGQRRSMSRSFIPKAKEAGAQFITYAKAQKINFHGDRAYEALCIFSDKRKTSFRVRFKSVFVCGGAIQTPFLLRKSGLTQHIGERLKTHLSAKLVACFDERASDPHEGVPVMQVSEFKPQLTLGGSFSSPAYLALWLAGRKDFARIMQSPSNLGIFYASIIANAHGRVRTEPFSGEAMLSMNIKDDDLFSIGDGIYKLGQMLFAAGAKIIYSPIIGGKDFRTLADMGPLLKGGLFRGMDLSTMHLFSSCPMGENLSRCALNSFGRVHGKRNIFVNDASMLPDAPGTNPQALIMAIARRNATHWLEVGCKDGF